jgi:hypothetical protein
MGLPVHRDYSEGIGDEMDRKDLPTACTFLWLCNNNNNNNNNNTELDLSRVGALSS